MPQALLHQRSDIISAERGIISAASSSAQRLFQKLSRIALFARGDLLGRAGADDGAAVVAQVPGAADDPDENAGHDDEAQDENCQPGAHATAALLAGLRRIQSIIDQLEE